MHYWGDDWPYWNDLYEAQRMLHNQLRNVYHLPLTDLKEKYGTLRIWITPSFTLHNLLWPGHCFCRWPKWLHFMWKLDIYFWPKFGRYTGLTWLYNQYVNRAYTMSMEKVARAFPHIKAEILSDGESSLLRHMTDWNKYWVKSRGERYPEPNPTWVAYWRQHEQDTKRDL